MKLTSNFFNLALIAVLAFLALGNSRPSAAAPAALIAAQPHSSATAACDTGRSVQVSGAAVVYVTPDRALIQLGVQSNGATPDLVYDANAEQVRRVIAAMRGLGVDAKDIASDHYLVYPVYNDYSDLTIKGYRIDNTVSVTLRDVSLAETVLLTALKSGANQVQDVQFYTSQLRAVRDQAREQAMQAAGEKAQAISGAAGASVGCVLSISENTWTQYYGSWRGGRETAIWAQNVAQNFAGGQGDFPQLDDSPISLGQIAIRAEINASYSLE